MNVVGLLMNNSGSSGSGGAGIFLALTGGFFLVYIGILVAIVAGCAKMFVKMDLPWYYAIIPVYNCYLMAEKVWGEKWYFIFAACIPVLNAVVAFKFCWDVGRVFGQGVGVRLACLFAAPIAYLVLGFGSAEYVGAVDPLSMS